MATDTARHIFLTVTQRVGLENMLAEAQGERRPNREESLVLNRVRRKVRLTVDQKRDLEQREVIVRHNGSIGIDEERAAKERVERVYLETEEVRKLREWGNAFQHPNMVAILDWLEPIMEQLEAKIVESREESMVTASR